MSSHSSGPEALQLVPISVEQLKDNTSTHFDIYACPVLTQQKDVILYAKAPYTWSLRELTELARVGLTQLYVTEGEKTKYDSYLRLNDVPKVDPSLEPRFRINKLQDVGAHLISAGFLGEVSPEFIQKIETVATDIVACLIEDPRCVLQIKTLADHDLYTYIHSVGVGTLSAAIALALGEKDAAVLKMFAMGGLLHDIGKKDVQLKVLNKAGPLTSAEWDEMKRHPEFGLLALKDMGVATEILEIVGMHHEKVDGSGYPNGLKAGAIPRHVQIATIADVFNALTTARCYHFKRTRFEGLMFMKHNMAGKISPELFKGLVQCLVSDASAEQELKAS